MKDHEIIELIITTVCEYYEVDWRDTIKDTRGIHLRSEIVMARRLCFHLLYMFISEDTASEIMGYKINSLPAISSLVRSKQKTALNYITKAINDKQAA